MKEIKPDGSKTLYVGGLYEVDKTSGGTVTQTRTYYPAAGAMRIGSTLYYTLKDQLGSASVVTNNSGVTVGETRYYPFGETRFSTGTMYTDKLFTGQRDTGLGIYYYGARFYSQKLGRFISPDSIVPGAGNPQAFNRYSYVLNNPIRYNDPTGHAISCDAEQDCKETRRVDKLSAKAYVKEVLKKYKVGISDGFSNSQSIAILAGVVKVGAKFASERGFGESGSAAFGAVYGGVTFTWDTNCKGCRPAGCGNNFSGDCTPRGGFTAGEDITFASMSGQLYTDMDRMVKNVVHELGHAFDNSLSVVSTSGVKWSRADILRSNPGDPQHWDWQQSPSTAKYEIFADMFIAWTYDAWNTSTDRTIVNAVGAAQNWMNGLP